jgi:hypothetical protein
MLAAKLHGRWRAWLPYTNPHLTLLSNSSSSRACHSNLFTNHHQGYTESYHTMTSLTHLRKNSGPSGWQHSPCLTQDPRTHAYRIIEASRFPMGPRLYISAKWPCPSVKTIVWRNQLSIAANDVIVTWANAAGGFAKRIIFASWRRSTSNQNELHAKF